jgi:hypothetical protein
MYEQFTPMLLENSSERSFSEQIIPDSASASKEKL